MHQWNITSISDFFPILVHGFVSTWEDRPLIFASAIQMERSRRARDHDLMRGYV
jgi:hypothetical protein